MRLREQYQLRKSAKNIKVLCANPKTILYDNNNNTFYINKNIFECFYQRINRKVYVTRRFIEPCLGSKR